ncbi:MAG: hypothetical protein KAZ98_05160 [Prevotella sp.]|nr:hypothetical protein [Prevotella sp.]
MPRGKRKVENTKIVVNKGEVENIDVSFANGKMAKVANNSACGACLALASELGIAARTRKRVLSKFTNTYQIILPVKYGVCRKPPIKQA